MHLTRDDADAATVDLSGSVFEKGFFKTLADIKAGGLYTVRLYLDGPAVKKSFSIDFTIQDERKKTLIIIIALMYFGSIPATVYIIQRRKSCYLS
jgi:hypothetical protein